MLQCFLCQDNDKYHSARIASISHEIASFFHVVPCRILLKNVLSIFEAYIKCQIKCQNFEAFISMLFLFEKLSYFTFQYDKYLFFHESTDYFRISTRREEFRATPGTMRKIRVNQS